jgi:hypothetical protein
MKGSNNKLALYEREGVSQQFLTVFDASFDSRVGLPFQLCFKSTYLLP